MELIRKLLLAVEDWPATGGDRTFASLGADPEELDYNLHLAKEGGLLEFVTAQNLEGSVFKRMSLTWSGHDFLDAAREQPIWEEVMTSMKTKGIASASLELMKKMLDKALRKRLDVD
jgi:hypothetical protein